MQYNEDTYDNVLSSIGYKEKYINPGAILWSPSSLVESACSFLCEGDNKKILDIGSGVGKFCIEGAHFNPKCHFTGVELDIDRHNVALRVQDILTINNATFVHGNFIDMDLSEFDGIFLFNPFNMGAHVIHNEGKALQSADYMLSDGKHKKIDTTVREMRIALLDKVSTMKVGSKVAMYSMYISLENTGIWEDTGYGKFIKIK